MESPGPSSPPATSATRLRDPSHGEVTKPTGRKNPWLGCLLPFLVFMVAGSFEPGKRIDGQPSASNWIELGIEYVHYPLVYTAKILLAIAAMVYVLPGYRQISCRSASPL